MTNLEQALLIICIYLFSILVMVLHKPLIKQMHTASPEMDTVIAWFLLVVFAPIVATFIIITSPFFMGRD